MEGKIFIALLVVGLVSTALGKGGHRRHHDDDDHHHGKRRGDYDKCPQPTLSKEFPMKCTVTDHCGTYTCSGEFEGETVTLSLKIDRSQDPLSADISLKVPGLDYEWTATFKSGDKIQVPGFPLTLKGIGGADMYLMLTMEKHYKGISFQLDLILTSDMEPVDVTLLEGKLPMKYGDHDRDDDDDHHRRGRCSRAWGWFKRQPAGVKAAVVISAILVFSLVITGLVYCCKKRRTPKGVDMVKVVPPSYDEATTIKTKVPLEPLVNEE